jgi:UDP-N-acetylmuramoyl-tripeptide--D-alanyl-D-alanine ligase
MLDIAASSIQYPVSSTQHPAMEDFTIGDILRATKGQLVKGESCSVVSGISTDSRTLEKDDLFVTLIGERFDGHDFIVQAVSRGAMGVLASRDVEASSVKALIMVEDTLQALGDIARSYRSRFSIPVVGITGSNGKTTTKDMTSSVLSQRYSVLKSEGNFNNAIGVPLTLFRLSRAHEIAVIEMGTGAPGEMSRLVEIARPDVAVITNVGPTHLEFFGSIDEVAAEKGILARAASSAVLNADDPFVAKMRDAVDGKTISFALARDDLTGRDTCDTILAAEIMQDRDGRSEFTLTTSKGKIRVYLASLGRHNVYNALAAASVGVLFHVGLDKIKKALESYKGVPMRMQKVAVDGATIIDDTYNSNPISLRAAVDFLSEAECDGKRIVVVGDMLELGERSDELHREAGRFIARRPIHTLVTVGNRATKIAEAALNDGISKDRVVICETNVEAVTHLHSILGEGDIALVKGSRGMKMEEIVEALCRDEACLAPIE